MNLMKTVLVGLCVGAAISLTWAQADAPSDVPELARVRVAHFAPNTPLVDLTFQGGDGATLALEPFVGLEYGDSTPHIEVTPGEYTLALREGEAESFAETTVTFEANRFYSLLALGLIDPGEEDTGNFLDTLFGTGGDLALRLELYDDELATTLSPGEVLLRVLHASPGTAPLALVSTTEGDALTEEVAFAEVSAYVALAANRGDLGLQFADAQAVPLDLTTVPLEAGQIHTLVLTGTPEEEVPFEAILFSDPALLEGVTPDTVQPTTPADPADPPAADEPLDEDEASDEPGEGASNASIADLARSDPRFSILITAIEQAGLLDTIGGDSAGLFTLFAPTDEAFNALPEDELTALLADEQALAALLRYHLVEGELTSSELAEQETVTTLEGLELPIEASGDTLSVGGATVSEADILASNGVIHAIESVLLLPEGATVAPE